MMRSLYSGISGLTNHQTRMDVIANNIANVNTVGYKRSRTIFQDIYSQMARQGSAGTETQGGINTSQIGLGVKLSTIDVVHTSSAIARSDNPLDVMIEGDGFFILNTQITETGTAGAGYEYYTRAGDFKLDNNNMLVSSHGYYVMGYLMVPITDTVTQQVLNPDYEPGVSDPSEMYIDEDVEVIVGYEPVDRSAQLSAIDVSAYEQVAIDAKGVVWGLDANKNKVQVAVLSIATFANNAGLERAGSSLFIEAGPSGKPVYNIAGDTGVGIINTGGTEMSNVDLATEFTDMIVTQRGFQANSRIITVSDTMLEELVNLKRG